MASAHMFGQLTVEVKEGKNLHNVNLFAKMDPYVLLSVGSSDEKYAHQHPYYDHP